MLQTKKILMCFVIIEIQRDSFWAPMLTREMPSVIITSSPVLILPYPDVMDGISAIIIESALR